MATSSQEAFDLKTKRPVIAKRSPYAVEVKKGETYYWCVCGRSKNQPFCDGSHVGSGFDGPLPYEAKEDGEAYFCGCKHTKNPPMCDGTHASGLPPEEPAKEDDATPKPPSSIDWKEFTDGAATYPPKQGGLNGQTGRALSIMHGIKFGGKKYDLSHAQVHKTDPETFDCIILGAGASGLSAAYFYQQRFGKDSKILILDPLNDFGGHCKRNEFEVNGRTIIGYAGSESLQSPEGTFPQPVKDFVTKDLGFNLKKFETDYFQADTYLSRGMSRGSYWKNGTLATGDPTAMVADDMYDVKPDTSVPLKDYLAQFPYSEETKAQLLAVFEDKEGVTLSDMTNDDDREAYLAATSYADFLTDKWKLNADAIAFLRRRMLDFYGLPAEGISVLDAGWYGHPGTQGIKLPENEEAVAEMTERYVHHCPDGNASIARLTVAKLIPQAFPTAKDITGPESLLTHKVDVAALDKAEHNVKIRLNSTGVKITQSSDASQLEVGYVINDGSSEDLPLFRARTKHCIPACFGVVMPHIIDDALLPPESDQATALSGNTKAPLVYTNVCLRNWEAFAALKVHEAYPVDGFHCRLKLDYPVSMGDYAHSKNPSEPIVVHMVYVPDAYEKHPGTSNGMGPRDGFKKARYSLFNLGDFESYAVKVKEDLETLLKPTGKFDFERDVAAVTVNRWSHGYAWVGNSLAAPKGKAQETYDADRKAGTQKLANGKIAVAGSDSELTAYLQGAIAGAHRAVNDLSA